jgi:BA14K-like protein
MEPMMISLKVLSTVAALALVLPMVAPAASFAQSTGKVGGVRGGGGGVRPGGGAPAARFSGGGAPGARFGSTGGPGPRYGGGGRGYGYGGGVVPGVVAGAVIGGAIASQGYYGGPVYAPGYYDGDQYYDDSSVAVAPGPAGGGDAVAYCMQTYRSYDPASGTYMGNDGYRHPCP